MATRLVVEWTRGSVRLAVAQGRGAHWQLQTLYVQDVGSPAETVQALKQLIQDHELPSLNQVISVVPREHVITRMVRFPTTDPTELRQMVDLYAKSQLPYSREETIMNYDLLDHQDGFSVVNVVACQREVIERQLQMLEDAGMRAERITVSAWGVLGWFQRLEQSQDIANPVLIVHVDRSRVDFVIVADGHLLASRSLGQGVADWERVGSPVELLAVEVERSLAAIGKEFPGLAVKTLLITGLGDLEKWSEALQPKLSLPVVVADAGLPYADQKRFPAIGEGGSPVVAGGVACADLRYCLNLDPPELRRRIVKRRTTQTVLALSSVTALVVVLGAGVFGIEIMRQKQLAAQVDQALVYLGPKAREAREQKDIVDKVAGVIRGRAQLGGQLHGLLNALPETVQLEMLQYERRNGQVLLRGRAPTTDVVLQLIAQMEKLPAVASVDLRFSTQRSVPEGIVTAFELAVTARGSDFDG